LPRFLLGGSNRESVSELPVCRPTGSGDATCDNADPDNLRATSPPSRH